LIQNKTVAKVNYLVCFSNIATVLKYEFVRRLPLPNKRRV